MRLIVILIALLILGLLILRVIDSGSGRSEKPEPEIPQSSDAPAIPTRPQEVKGFEQQINKFISESESERAEKIERSQ